MRVERHRVKGKQRKGLEKMWRVRQGKRKEIEEAERIWGCVAMGEVGTGLGSEWDLQYNKQIILNKTTLSLIADIFILPYYSPEMQK